MSDYTKLNSDGADNEDIFIQPDVPSAGTSSAANAVPPPSNATPKQAASGGTSEGGFFNFASFVNPQAYIDPLLHGSNVEVRERQFTGGNTLDESVVTTLRRDLSSITDKLLSILWPLRLRQKLKVLERVPYLAGSAQGSERSPFDEDTEDQHIGTSTGIGSLNSDDYSKDTIKKILDWDLWGPLVINLSFSLIITYLQTRTLKSDADVDAKSSGIFSGAFTLLWAALAVLSLNIQLLSPVGQKTENGGTTAGIVALSFYQCISILSYTLFPVVLGGLISIFVTIRPIRLIINVVMLGWSLLCSWLILAIVNNCKTPGATPGFIYNTVAEADQGSEGDKRIFLMIYPIFLVYGLFSWFCVIV
ncbi:DEKNAAC103027 [Brettanomyces naardenensis]|uniref:Protein YIP n=1 Tax=Brettanomyces naardenensis TaxID=13370 RepID=A0A448YM39_BRENA|nr:DEKNAAC103027 [Brettanomyces naardenensis]